MKKIFTFFTVAVLGLSLTACKDYLDINYDPNNPSADVVNNDMILPAAEMALSAKYGDIMRIYGAYLAEHYAQYFGTSNYDDFGKFILSATRSNNPYSTIMPGCIGNATVIREKAAAAEQWGTYLAATVLRVFAFQAMADAYGEIPYSEAMDANNLNPKYDEGQEIYAGLVAELDEALSKVSPSDVVATNFLYSGQTAAPWIKFANALKLKLLMRESGVVNVSSQLASLINEGNFPESDVAWAGIWANESGKANPFWQEEFSTSFGSTQINCGLNVALFRAMSDYDDARLPAFFTKNGNGVYWGSISGFNMSTSSNYKAAAFCRPNMAYNSPVYLITRSEIEFFLSEYYMTAGNADQAKAHYEAAIKASFASAGVEGADAAIAAWPYDGSKKCIGVQKWIALSGTNNFEAWCEMRRLGYPAFGGKSANDIYSGDNLDPEVLTPGDLYTPWEVTPDVGANQLLQRWPYPQSSSNYNANAPETNKKPTEKVFWAK